MNSNKQPPAIKELTRFCPAKINLTLAIHHPRPDGFHELTSLVAKLAFGDQLHVSESTGSDSLTCSDPTIPTDASNLVLKAAAAFRSATGCNGVFKFHLNKQIPAGAGLGGGSSNGTHTLLALNEIHRHPLEPALLNAIAASLGSDCPLFLTPLPTVLCGRGEELHPVPEAASKALSGRSVVVFKPAFGINTGWAYQFMRENTQFYVTQATALSPLQKWLANPELPIPLFNNMMDAVGTKHLAIPTVLDEIRSTFGIPAMMSGSGSACFALPDQNTDIEALKALIANAFGHDALTIETQLL